MIKDVVNTSRKPQKALSGEQLEITEHSHESLGITETLLPYSHQEIAECTCLQRVTVTRQLKRLEEKGWIQTGYKKVLIVDREALTWFAYKTI